MRQVLFTPWRYAYITGKKSGGGCFLCAAAADPADPASLVVHVTEHHLVLLNRYPYSSGHLMVAPRAHLASPAEAESEAVAELWPLVWEAEAVLRETFSYDGLNMGMNLGAAAGAGVPDHFHLHLVPRWSGDVNFMGAVGGTHIVPENLNDTGKRLRKLFAEREI